MAMEMARSVAAIKSSVYSVQLCLLEGTCDEEKLQAAGRVLTQDEYADVVTERSIANMCGYPLCTKPLPSTFPRKGRYHISLREHKVYDLDETRLFCSSDCLIASKKFAASLSVERDYSSKTLEFVSAFHDLGIQDVGQQHVASSFASKKASVLIQELIGNYQENATLPVDLPASRESVSTQETQQLDTGTFLLIREQNECSVTEFSTAGPSNAIEGYIPQKQFSASRQKQAKVKQLKQKSTNLSFRNGAKELPANSANKKETKKKAECSNNIKESAIKSSLVQEPDFTSCILVDPGDLTTPQDLKSKINFERSCNESEKAHMPQIAVHKESPTQKKKQQCPRKHNRVSWADHHSQNLVEDLSHSIADTGSIILSDTSKVRVLQGESNWHAAPDSLTSNNGAANVNTQVGVLQGDVLEKSVAPGWSSSTASLKVQDVSHFRNECENTQDPTREERDLVHMCEEVTSLKGKAAFIGDGRARLEREDSNDGTDPRSENLESVNALVAALADAAEAVACGEVDSSEAVARAGISILPKPELPSSNRMKETNDLDKERESDVEILDSKDCWYSTPPKGFKPELSGFGTLWMALDSWISAASIAHLYGRDTNEQDSFAVVNGKEYLRQVIIPNGVSAEIERTLAGCISRTLSRIIEILRLPVPVSTLEASLGRLLRTMSFTTAIPSFSSKQWQVVALILLDGLSIHRLPGLRPRFLNGRQTVNKVLASANITEAEYEIFRDLILPMGMLPHFAAHCGG